MGFYVADSYRSEISEIEKGRVKRLGLLENNYPYSLMFISFLFA